jgi:hypothetical protein
MNRARCISIWQGVVLLSILGNGILAGAAQTNIARRNFQRSFLDSPAFSNSPLARATVETILATPTPAPTVPLVGSGTGRANVGTYWSLQKSNQPPWPGRVFPEMPAYAVGSNHFIVDDRAVDYVALGALVTAQALTNGTMSPLGLESPDYSTTTNLWLEIPEGGVATNAVTVVLHNTSEGARYALLTKADLGLPYWSGELTVTGAVGAATSAVLLQNDRTNLFIWARSGVTSLIRILEQPVSQKVLAGDTVTFHVLATGPAELSYQWFHDGTNLPGATTSSFAMENVQVNRAGDYQVVVSCGDMAAVSTTATLRVLPGFDDPNYMLLGGDRQDYTFKAGVTYEVASPVNLYGTTTLKGGTVIKVDWFFTNGTLRVLGNLVCDTGPYHPAILTSVDDDWVGKPLWYSQDDGPPQPYPGTPPYLDLTAAMSVGSVHDLRICHAEQGIATPAGRRLDLWNCQFLNCNGSVVNWDGGAVALHNVLFAVCGLGVLSGTNVSTVSAEHVTADTWAFVDGYRAPDVVALTNCLITGIIVAGTQHQENTVFDPAPGHFEVNNVGHYYLSATSALHHMGTTNVSAALLTAFRNKTTYVPLAIPSNTTWSGEVTLFPQVPRYTNGAPDLGYYYDVLDYTVADLTLAGARLELLAGTALGLRSDYMPDSEEWTWFGVELREGAALRCVGLPDRPNVIADLQVVQEQPTAACWAGLRFNFWPFQESLPPPQLDLRFTRLYTLDENYHVCAGTVDGGYPTSLGSVVEWRLRDCEIHGGRVNLGEPDFFQMPLDYVMGPGAVTWENTLFDQVTVQLHPTMWYYHGVANVDFRLEARHNLFRGGNCVAVMANPSSGGDWLFADNVFERVYFLQGYGAVRAEYNTYQGLSELELPRTLPRKGWWYQYGRETARLAGTNSAGSANGMGDVTLDTTLPYQAGPYGKYYLPTMTPLYHAGSRSFEDAGLAQYTTRADQITEGQELSGHAVNIGLHYVAATNSQLSTFNPQPRDSDGDGVADYVEDANGNDAVEDNETSPALAQTVAGINDATNSVYDDVDLSGNGLVGRIKRALGLNPLDRNNPLTLIPTGFDEEWGIAAFEVPINYTALTNAGSLNLRMNGASITLQEHGPATNGNTLIKFKEDFEPAGLHYLQPLLTVNTGLGGQGAIRSGLGVTLPYWSSNRVQFSVHGSMFDENGAYLDAKLFVPEADYTIELYDLSTNPAVLIKTITNSTTTGVIQEDWNVTLADGMTPFTGTSVKAVFNVTPAGALPNTARKGSKVITKEDIAGGLSEAGPNFNVVYMYTPTNNDLLFSYAEGGIIWNGMQSVVNVLINHQLGFEFVYESSFNRFPPDLHGEYPGYVTSRAQITNTLYPTLTNRATKQFYCYSHGSSTQLSDTSNRVFITTAEVSKLLTNKMSGTNLVTQHPYRFVFLDGCLTASTKEWAQAFGIYPLGDSTARNRVGPQAFVGWEKECASWMGGFGDPAGDADIAQAYTRTLMDFYMDWMLKKPLAVCITNATKLSRDHVPFPVPGYEAFEVTISGQPYVFPKVGTSKICVEGSSGLKINGHDPAWDGYYTR